MQKAITIKQPWASLIVDGLKDIENRTWKTKFRGRVLIHVSAKKASKYQHISLVELYRLGLTEEMILYANSHGFNFNSFHERTEFGKTGLIYSAIIGSVEIVDCVINNPSIWAEKTKIPHLGDVLDDVKYLGKAMKPDNIIYNWVLANPIKFDKPIYNVKGKLSFWNYEE